MPKRQDDIRARILDVARRTFADNDYEACTIRTIAEAAQVAPSTVIKHYGSKMALYREVVESFRLTDWTSRPSGTDPLARLVADFAALLGSSVSDEDVRQAMVIGLRGDSLGRSDVNPAWHRVDLATKDLAGRLEGADASLRAALATAFVTGVVHVRSALALNPLAEADRRDILRAALPALIALLAPRRPSNTETPPTSP